MAVPSPRQRASDATRLVCRLAAAPDLRTYLGVPVDASSKDALVALERRRRELEASLGRPGTPPEAELFLEVYGQLREALTQPAPDPADAPDWYAVLGVKPDAPFASIERAWRSAEPVQRDGDTLVAKAWQVLGDPAARAAYDRTRSGATHADPRDEASDPELDADPTGARLHVPGPDLREVSLDGATPAVVVLPIVVRGQGRWRGTIQTDHPAVSTQPDRMLVVGPGRHTIAVTVDPRRVRQRTLTFTVTIGNGQERHVVALRARRRDRSRALEWAGLGLGAAVLLGAGWLLGARTQVLADAPDPDTVGDVSQIPSAQPCLAPSYAPLPSSIDVHVDGLGRPTGVSFGGPASRAAETCVRDVVLGLEFPPTRDGRPAFHRYLVTALPPGPPPSSRGVP